MFAKKISSVEKVYETQSRFLWEINVFTKEVAKELISRIFFRDRDFFHAVKLLESWFDEIFLMSLNFSFFLTVHTVLLREKYLVKSIYLHDFHEIFVRVRW